MRTRGWRLHNCALRKRGQRSHHWPRSTRGSRRRDCCRLLAIGLFRDCGKLGNDRWRRASCFTYMRLGFTDRLLGYGCRRGHGFRHGSTAFAGQGHAGPCCRPAVFPESRRTHAKHWGHTIDKPEDLVSQHGPRSNTTCKDEYRPKQQPGPSSFALGLGHLGQGHGPHDHGKVEVGGGALGVRPGIVWVHGEDISRKRPDNDQMMDMAGAVVTASKGLGIVTVTAAAAGTT
jgi:hypothetical protein